MSVISTNSTILKVEALKTEFDLITVSNSLAIVLESYEEARIVQQLHSWIRSNQGIVIEGYCWFDKPIRDWINEVIPTASDWKMRSYISSLVSKGVLKRKKLFKKHHGHNFSPKNQTYYYRLDYEELSKLAKLTINSLELNNAGGEE
jgi:tRNA nucleotidyltransferase/poly(A) polymerase